MQSGPEQLRDWMKRRTLNQRETAELLGITEVFLSQLLNSKRLPGLQSALTIERLTGVQAESWLLTAVRRSDVADSDKPRKSSEANG